MIVPISTSLPVEAWDAIYYIDNQIQRFNSRNTTWNDLPQNGMVILIVWHELHQPELRKKTVSAGHDYYLISEIEFGTTDVFAEVSNKVYKRGIWVHDNQLFEQLLNEAHEKLNYD